MDQRLSARERHFETICARQYLTHPSIAMLSKDLALLRPQGKLSTVKLPHTEVLFGFVNVSANNHCLFLATCNYGRANRIEVLTTDGLKLEDDPIDLSGSGSRKRLPCGKDIFQLFNAKEDIFRIRPVEYHALGAGKSVTTYSLSHRYKDRNHNGQERAYRRNSLPIKRANSFPGRQNDSETDSNYSYPKRLRPIGFRHPRLPFIFPERIVLQAHHGRSMTDTNPTARDYYGLADAILVHVNRTREWNLNSSPEQLRREVAVMIETGLQSQLRAPVADEAAIQPWVDRFSEISDMGRRRDAWNAALASAPVAEKKQTVCVHFGKVGSAGAFPMEDRWVTMRCKPISVTIPFVAPAGTSGTVTLRHDVLCGDKARLAVGMGHQVNGRTAGALRTVEGVHRLIDGLMDAIDSLERKGRVHTEDSHD